MSSTGTKLSAKDQIGYEVFFFTAVYGLYNVFFSNPVLVDSAVFTFLFGSLFVRYHLVVSNEELSDSRAAKWTGNILLIIGVTISSHFVYKHLKGAIDWFNLGDSPLLILIASGVLATAVLALANHPVFRYDEQRREMFKEEISEGGVTGLISRLCLYLDRQVSRTEYGDNDRVEPFENFRTVGRKVRKGEIETINKYEARRAAKVSENIFTVLITGFHAFLSVALLLIFTVLFEVFWNIEAVEMLAVVVVVASFFYTFVLLHLRFGLRREVSRSFWMMPIEFILCTLVTHFTLFNADLIGGGAVLITVPFFLHLFSNWAGLLSKGMIVRLMYYLVDSPDEYREVMREAMGERE